MTHTNTQDSNYDWASTQYTDKEVSLLVIIQENSRLPESDQLRYQQLWCKCENETISDDELAEYQMLLSQLEDRNLKRICEVCHGFSAIQRKYIRGNYCRIRGHSTHNLKVGA